MDAPNNLLDVLDDHALHYLLSFLHGETLAVLSCTCKTINNTIKQDLRLWKRLCSRRWITPHIGGGVSSPPLSTAEDWRMLYRTCNHVDLTETQRYDIVLQKGTSATAPWQHAGQFWVGNVFSRCTAMISNLSVEGYPKASMHLDPLDGGAGQEFSEVVFGGVVRGVLCMQYACNTIMYSHNTTMILCRQGPTVFRWVMSMVSLLTCISACHRLANLLGNTLNESVVTSSSTLSLNVNCYTMAKGDCCHNKFQKKQK